MLLWCYSRLPIWHIILFQPQIDADFQNIFTRVYSSMSNYSNTLSNYFTLLHPTLRDMNLKDPERMVDGMKQWVVILYLLPTISTLPGFPKKALFSKNGRDRGKFLPHQGAGTPKIHWSKMFRQSRKSQFSIFSTQFFRAKLRTNEKTPGRVWSKWQGQGLPWFW